MTIQTKILCIDETEHSTVEVWEKFRFDVRCYISHSEHDYGSTLYLSGMPGPVVIQLTFEELSFELENLNTFEYLSMN
jgi:hypothetical protein